MTEYKVISDWFCMTSIHKARKMERHLNTHAKEGWEFAAVKNMLILGFDVGFYLILKRAIPHP
jgi:hypothetical protein